MNILKTQARVHRYTIPHVHRIVSDTKISTWPIWLIRPFLPSSRYNPDSIGITRSDKKLLEIQFSIQSRGLGITRRDKFSSSKFSINNFLSVFLPKAGNRAPVFLLISDVPFVKSLIRRSRMNYKLSPNHSYLFIINCSQLTQKNYPNFIFLSLFFQLDFLEDFSSWP